MNIYSYRQEQLTETLNQALDLVMDKAFKKGFITDEQMPNILRLRVIASDNQNIFSKFWKGFFGKENKLVIHVVTIEKDPNE